MDSKTKLEGSIVKTDLEEAILLQKQAILSSYIDDEHSAGRNPYINQEYKIESETKILDKKY